MANTVSQLTDQNALRDVALEFNAKFAHNVEPPNCKIELIRLIQSVSRLLLITFKM